MAKLAEIKLRPGWLANDVKRAKSRLEQWNGAWERASAVLPADTTMIDRVILAMERYAVVKLTDGTIGIEDVNENCLVRHGLKPEDEPYDICNELNARSIIAAMREPTGDMCAVECESGRRAHIWRAMIDVALTPYA